MKIELLYFDGCPCWLQTESDIESLLAEQGLQETIEHVKVETNEEAQRQRFVGSPSVRIDGVDIDPDAPEDGFNMECRLYWVDGRPVGVPPRQMLSDAISMALEHEAAR